MKRQEAVDEFSRITSRIHTSSHKQTAKRLVKVRLDSMALAIMEIFYIYSQGTRRGR
jgi:hypothetical protein